MKIPFFLRVFFYIVVPFWLGTWILIYFLYSDNNRIPRNYYLDKRTDTYESVREIFTLLERNKQSFEWHAKFLWAYTNIPYRDQKLFDVDIEKNFGNLYEFYEKKAGQNNSADRNLGVYGKTLFDFRRKGCFECLDMFNQLAEIKPDTLPYLNELKADVLTEYGYLDSAIVFYQREISLNKTNTRAYQKYLPLLIQKGRYDNARNILEQGQSLNLPFDFGFLNWATYKLSFSKWISTLYKPLVNAPFYPVGWAGFIILLGWIMVLFSVNVFKERILWIVLLCLVVSLLIVPLTITLYNLLEFYFQYEWQNIFLEQWLKVGLVEEIFKLLPTLIVWRFLSKNKRTPFVLILLAGVSALVFSFSENLLYFGEYYNLTIITSRALFSTGLHVVASSLVVYGFMLFRYKKKHWVYIIIFFVAGFTTHALYNFLLHTGFSVLAFLIVLGGLYAWSSMLTNALNNSPYFDPGKLFNSKKPVVALMIGLAAIVVVELALNTYCYGFQNANSLFGYSILKAGGISLVMAFSFMSIHLEQGKWIQLDVFALNEINVFGSATGKQMVCLAGKQTKDIEPGIRFKAQVQKKLKDSKGETWYLVKTNLPQLNQALIRFKEEGANFFDFDEYVYLLNASSKPPENSFKVADFPFLGFIKISPDEEIK